MKERGILFSAPMVRALLDGRKTQTRRVVKSPHLDLLDRLEREYGRPIESNEYGVSFDADGVRAVVSVPLNCPYGAPGDRLWVREAWQQFDLEGDAHIPRERFGPHNPLRGCENDREIIWAACYRADGELAHPEYGAARWRPGIHMPRWASRITLEITAVRVERLHAITGRDVLAEGVDNGKSNPAQGERWENMQRLAFEELWSKINGAESWNANPWVWVVEFRRIEQAKATVAEGRV